MAFRLTLNGTAHELTILRRQPRLVLLIDGEEHEISADRAIANGRGAIGVDGRGASFVRASVGDRQFLRLAGRTFEVDRVSAFSDHASAGGGQNVLRAPMPGAIISIHRRAGDAVILGETIVTIESMKLQTALLAPRDGVIAEIFRTEGETFEKDEVIVALAPEPEKA